MARILIEGYLCERCLHSWAPRGNAKAEPKICPKCKTTYWNKPRKLEINPNRRAAIRGDHLTGQNAA